MSERKEGEHWILFTAELGADPEMLHPGDSGSTQRTVKLDSDQLALVARLTGKGEFNQVDAFCEELYAAKRAAKGDDKRVERAGGGTEHRVHTLVYMKNGRWFGRYRIGGDPQIEIALEVDTREHAESKLAAFVQHAVDEKDRARFARATDAKPIWWRNGVGNREAGLEVGRTSEHVDVRLLMHASSFLTAPHRVEPRGVAAAARRELERADEYLRSLSEPQRDISFNEISLVPLGTQPDPEAMIWRPEDEVARPKDSTYEIVTDHRGEVVRDNLRLPREESVVLAAIRSRKFYLLKLVEGGVYDVRFHVAGKEFSSSTGEVDRVRALQVAEKIYLEMTRAHHEASGEYVDEKIISQGGGWATFRRNGDWWAERREDKGGELGMRRLTMALSTADDAVAGQRFYALQNEFRNTPLDELLTATFALRMQWARERAPVVALGLSAGGSAMVHESLLATAVASGDVKPAAGMWLGVSIESGATVGDLRLRPALGGEWLVVLETEREPGDRDAVVVSGPRDKIDALTRAWIQSIAALVES